MDDMDILAENVIEIEEVKEEPDDYVEEQDWSFTEQDRHLSLKSELKKEDDEEEVKPPVSVFLDPNEESHEDDKQQHEDPLAMCNENFVAQSVWSVGEFRDVIGLMCPIHVYYNLA
ncbi:hypothetical protein R5R35_011182 [Gryllus longicercus]|uniref:Uncharacterized protein n=1 Tax=Gryllus longicercus TaxID=2509291 RepID=A0AAN9VGV8_9ORTH